ncbi:MAG: hypothetical protein IMZ61_16200 [Planctomycetes bacterium]|nr:hypothetical protein [Planctomycetota bacterium]
MAQNNGQHFIRMLLPTERLSRDSQREYPQDVFPFGDEEIKLFAHGQDPNWSVTEKFTGCRIAQGETMDLAIEGANQVVDEYGHDKFVELIKRILKNLNDGLEYDGQEWIDPNIKPIMAPEISGAADD